LGEKVLAQRQGVSFRAQRTQGGGTEGVGGGPGQEKTAILPGRVLKKRGNGEVCTCPSSGENKSWGQKAERRQRKGEYCIPSPQAWAAGVER